MTPTADSETTSLDVTWAAPMNDGGRDIDDYDLEYRVKTPQGARQVHDPAGTGTSTTIGSLQPGTTLRGAGAGGERRGRRRLVGLGARGAPSPSTPRRPSAGRRSAFTLAENADGGTTAVAVGTVSATDADGDAVSYSITAGNGAGKFAIVASTGAITYTGSGENYETISDPANAFTLTVQAADSNGGTADATVVVAVTDVAETPGDPGAPALTSSEADSLTVEWTASTNTGPGGHLRRGVPPGDERELDRRPAGRDGRERDHRQPSGEYRLPGARAGRQRRGHERVGAERVARCARWSWSRRGRRP